MGTVPFIFFKKTDDADAARRKGETPHASERDPAVRVSGQLRLLLQAAGKSMELYTVLRVGMLH